MASSRNTIWTVVFAVIIVLMAAEIAVLINENRKLKTSLDELTAMFEPLAADQRLPALSGEDVNGMPFSLRYGNESPTTVVLWFSPSCDACEGNLDFWNSLCNRYASENLRFIALCAGTADEARAFANAHAMPYPVVAVTDSRLLDAYRGHVLPQTVVVSPDGMVLQAWPGTLEPDAQNEIIRAVERIRTGSPVVD